MDQPESYYIGFVVIETENMDITKIAKIELNLINDLESIREWLIVNK